MKINRTPSPALIEKRNSLLKRWETEYTVEDGKKTVKTLGKGDESPSRYFTHITQELERRGQL